MPEECPSPTPTPRPVPPPIPNNQVSCQLFTNIPNCNSGQGFTGVAKIAIPQPNCCVSDPILIDLGNSGFAFTDIAGGVKFDLRGDGQKFQTAWPTANSDDAWLVLDRDGNGTIDSGREMFGNFTPQVTDAVFANGFLAMAEYDKPEHGGNNDGKLDALDVVFPFLQLWQDANHNGYSEPVELTTVASRNIVSLPLTYIEATVTDQYGNRFSLKNNVTLSDGSQRVICDAYPLFVPIEVKVAVELFVCDGTGLAAGTVSWSGPPTSVVVFDSPQGEIFAFGNSITGSKVTEKELYHGRSIYLVDTADGQVLASTTVGIGSITPMNSGNCVLYAETIRTCDGAGSTTVSWNASSWWIVPSATATQVRLGSFNGPVFASGGTQGSQVGNFNAPQTFFLVNVTNGSPGVLLKTFTVGFTTPTQGCAISASPNPIRMCDGTGLATASLKWNAPGVSTTEIRLNSVTGQFVASGGSTGNFTTGKSVTNGMKFVLRDVGTGSEIGSTTVVVTSNNCGTTKSDFDHDRKTDLTVWRGTDTNWLITPSAGGAVQTVSWGSSNAPYNDQIVPGDYDGDGKTDLAVWRPNLGEWWIKRSSDAQIQQIGWGSGAAPYNDVPVPGDYDGDGKTDLAVWRPSEGNWYIWRSSDAQWQVKPWGSGVAPYNDIPVPADYDGDGKTDLAVWRTSDNKWYIKRSSDYQVQITTWGSAELQYNDLPVPADYDGDYKADLAVFRRSTGTWYILKSSDGTFIIQTWGLGTDIPVPGDYDSDSKMDIAVWRPSDGIWYVIRSSNSTMLIQQHGQQGDTPVPSAGVR
ncbi:MAG: VCBS repeat-containing protein [Acidobacteria bacterium]|nr:VCBS repeat-containing protein [Acidobacteriota bacterium]